MRTKARILLLLLVIGLSAAAAHAVCPTGAVYVDLKANPLPSVVLIPLTGLPPAVTISGAANSPVPQCNGWKEAVLKIDLAANGATCTRANIVAEWETLPALPNNADNWTLNIGDSPTNDGFGGDANSTMKDAELWIVDEVMGVAPNDVSPGTHYIQHLGLTDSALKFVVKNRFISWGQPYAFLQTPGNNANQLFAFPDNGPGTIASEIGSKIYVGLNRVVASLSGPPAQGRRGCGLRRVLVTLQ